MSTKSWKDVWNAGPGPKTRKEAVVLGAKGFCMGTADLIPGVSGGTVAFITGIYENLLEAVASLDKNFFKALCTFQIKEAFSKVHLRFILPLFIGLATAILSLARVMHYLMNEQTVPTWAAFFGLIAASIIIIWKDLKNPYALKNAFLIALGAVFSWQMVNLIPVTTPENPAFIFLCGIIGITAMILPGLSGSFLLLILGKYEFITGAIKNPFILENFQTIVVFLCGTVTGLLGFSKILNWFMKHYRCETMAVLTGILIGSMRKVWPWKEVLESKIIRGKVKVLRDTNVMPSELNTETMVAIAFIILGFIAILVLENKVKHKDA